MNHCYIINQDVDYYHDLALESHKKVLNLLGDLEAFAGWHSDAGLTGDSERDKWILETIHNYRVRIERAHKCALKAAQNCYLKDGSTLSLSGLELRPEDNDD